GVRGLQVIADGYGIDQQLPASSNLDPPTSRPCVQRLPTAGPATAHKDAICSRVREPAVRRDATSPAATTGRDASQTHCDCLLGLLRLSGSVRAVKGGALGLLR